MARAKYHRKAIKRRERREQRAEQVMQAVRAVAAVKRAPPVDPVLDISALQVSPEDVQAAGFATEILVWFIARCQPSSERKALAALRERRLSAYMPIERTAKKVRDARTVVERPLLTGYLFVGLPTEDHQHLVRHVTGIEGLVSVAGKAHVFSAWKVLAIAAAEAAGAFDRSGPRKPVYRHGQKVRVSRGQWLGQLAEIVDASAEDRLRILIEGKFIHGEVDVSNDEVEAVEEFHAA